MVNFNKINNVAGWAIFFIAAATYITTCEPTVSLWDCGEFIATAFRLEVGHPPGAPFFMLLARIATLFAGNEAAQAAKMVNYFSAIAAAFTILFLFWTITYFARKLFSATHYNFSQIIIIIGSGATGALAYTFSDTFWFSAVEAEVYATSSLFTAVVFWAVLKWENVAGSPGANRWLILIAYLMGLSIGVHLLNLLAIPAIVMVYYFKKYKFSYKGLLYALGLSFAILAFVMYGIISGVVKVASLFELFFVNTLEMPFNSGLFVFVPVVFAAFVASIWYSIKKAKPLLNMALLCIAMILLGYTSYATILIRASAGPPINENTPDNIFSLLTYLNREQYGNRPLLHGQYYNAPVTDVKETSPKYAPYGKKYIVSGYNYEVEYDKRFTTFFPRMYSTDGYHIAVYKNWGEIKGRPVNAEYNGSVRTEYVPTFTENLKFFINYQIGQMYIRYFMWNFVGRQNDQHGSGGILRGNWISGINFIDNKLLGPQSQLPETAKNDPSRNTYYFLPLLLGLAGAMFMFERSKRNLLITFLLFFMTGIAIVVYLNQTPMQPRERDYAYAGSFYAFSIWIGIGVAAIYSWFKRPKNEIMKALVTSVVCLLAVPVVMAYENFDDHNRAGRYTARAYAYNYLNSCAPNAILFTFGDNDTFPLWYLQEVEGIRTDVRVVNTMLLNTEWYIEQLQKKAWLSNALPISYTNEHFRMGRRSRIYIIDNGYENMNIAHATAFVASNDPHTKTIGNYSRPIDYLPTKNLYIPVDTAVIFSNKSFDRCMANLVPRKLEFTLNDRFIDRSQLMVLDILAQNNWERPVYFTAINNGHTLGLDRYMQPEGFAYRLVPIADTSNNADFRINTAVMYQNLMQDFIYGNMSCPNVYIDHFNRRTLDIINFRKNFMLLAQALVAENKKRSAIAVLDKCFNECPIEKLPLDKDCINIAQIYFEAGAKEKATHILKQYNAQCKAWLIYLNSQPQYYKALTEYERAEYEKSLEQTELLLAKFNMGS